MATRAKPRPASRAQSVQQLRTPHQVGAWLVEDYAVPLVALEFEFKGGAGQDPEGRAGAAAMLAGLLDEGAGKYDSQGFQTALDETAVELSFNADRDHFAGRMRTLVKNADAAFEFLRLALNEARLEADPLERVRAQMTAGIRSEANDPDALAGKAWRAAAFPGHPYGLPVHGTLESVAAVTRGDLTAMRTACFSRATLKIAVVGALDAARAEKLIDHALSGLPERAALHAVADIGVHGVGSRSTVDLDIPQATIRFGAAGIARKDPDHIAAVIVNHILGGGVFSARLFKEVREKRGLAYSVYSSVNSFDHTAIFAGGTSTKNERAAESLAVIEKEIRKLSDKGPTARELEEAKKFLTGSYALRFDTSSKIANQLVNLQMEGFGTSYLDERNAMIDAVTLGEAKRVARRLLGDGKMLVTVAGRPEGL